MAQPRGQPWSISGSSLSSSWMISGVVIGVVIHERLWPPTQEAMSNADVEEKVKT